MQPNPHAATAPKETHFINGKRAYCDGDGAGGHPGVYLNAGEKPFVDCPYCGRRFSREAPVSDINQG